MWSEQPSSAEHESAVAAIRSVLPEPSSDAASATVALNSQAIPEQVAHLFHDRANFIWLDGNTTKHLLFRDPLALISCDGVCASVRGPGGSVCFAASSFDLLQAALHLWGGPRGGVLAGYIAYDVAEELEDFGNSPSTTGNLPRLQFGLYDSVLIYESARWFVAGTDAWRGQEGLSRAACEEEAILQRAAIISLPPSGDGGKLSTGPLSKGLDCASFMESVERIVKRVYDGDFFQTNLCRRFEAPLAADAAWPLYRRMRQLSASDNGAFLQCGGGRTLLSLSPEMFLTVTGGGVVESRPIKGTRPRGRTIEQDRILREELLGSAKDRAELSMIVDVSRNDLSRVCAAGSVQVVEHATLLTLPTLHHTFSHVRGRLRKDATVTDLLRASFPPASITGAPKIAAMQAAFQEEECGRGPCMGSIGWISLDGRLELSVAIRTAVTDGEKITYLAGCGITCDSLPLAEFKESQAKASAFLAALGLTRNV